MGIDEIPGKYHREGVALKKGCEERSVGAWRRVCWHGGHGGRSCHRGRLRRRCRILKPRLCCKHRTGSSLALFCSVLMNTEDHKEEEEEEGIDWER